MLGRGSLRALAHRAAHDALEEVWHDVKFGVAAVLFATLVGSTALGLPWDNFILANIIGFASVPIAAFLYRFVRAIHHPDRHPDWAAREPIITTHPMPIIILGVDPRKPIYVGRNRVEATDPDGSVWNEAEGRSEPQ